MSTTTTAGLSLDRSEALRFLQLLGKDPAQTRFRFFAPKGHPMAAAIGARKGVGFRPAEIEHHQAAGCGAYAVIGDGGDTDATITSVPALFVEWDNRPVEWQVGAWSELGLPEPSLQVETGGKSVHSYWVLREPLPPDQWREVTARLIRHCDSDRTISNPSRVMRLPGAHYIGADGRPIAQSRIITAAGHRYRLEQILAGVAELPAQPAGKPTSTLQAPPCGPRPPRRTDHPARPLSAIKEALAAIPPILPDTGQRETYRAMAWGLLEAVRDAGESDAVALDLLVAHSPAVTDAAAYLRTNPNSITAGTFWHLAKEAGWRPRGGQQAPVLPWLRSADQTAAAGTWLGDAAPIPDATTARLVALCARMGAGKTEAIAAAVAPHLRDGRRVVVISHRRSLGSALAERLGVPWADEAAPGEDLRQTGIALCIDSLTPNSKLQFRATDWTDAVVVVDEAAAVLAHGLMARGTAIDERRRSVLVELGALLANAHQILVADAQLSESVLQAIEAAAGGVRAHVISSEHKPAAGRQLVVHPDRESWSGALVTLVRQHRRLWISTTSQRAGGPNSAKAIVEKVQLEWPAAHVLLVDSETAADPDHDAHQLAADPDRIAAAYDVVVVTPAIQSGVSVDAPFDAVLAIAGGTTDAAGVAQSMARVRGDCIRHLYAPEKSPGGRLLVGCGATDPDRMLKALDRSTSHLVAQLLAAGTVISTGTTGPWLRLWAQLAAEQNRTAGAYRQTVVAMLQQEGYRVELAADPELKGIGAAARTHLQEIAAAQLAAEDAAVIAAALLTDDEAKHLKQEKRRRGLSPSERAQLARWRIGTAWGLGDAPPTQAIIDADREGAGRALRFRWLVSDVASRPLAQSHDRAVASALAANGAAWGPDLAHRTLGPSLAAADALQLHSWLERGERGEWFTADDRQLVALQVALISCKDDGRQMLGITPGERGTATLRRLLRLVGGRLKAERLKGRTDGNRDRYRYRVVLDPLPAGVDPDRLRQAWIDALQHPGRC